MPTRKTRHATYSWWILYKVSRNLQVRIYSRVCVVLSRHIDDLKIVDAVDMIPISEVLYND
jgi:hypothetical protein